MPPLKNIFNLPAWKMPTFTQATSTRNLPNQGGSYEAPTVQTNYAPNYNDQNAPAALPTKQYDNSFVTNRTIFNGGGGNNNTGGNNTSSVTVSRAKSPEEIAAALKKTMLAGDISNYSYWAMNNPDATTMETANIARRLQDTQGDIGSGATDPYKVASQSKWKFNAAELAAIEKAGAGVYDPAITSAITKLEMKQKEDTENAAKEWEKEKMKIQHGYAMEEKGLTAGGAGGGAGAGYVPGADPIVDSYVERINRGELASDVFKNIPGVANQALRDKVSAGMMATKYESAKALGSLDTINSINKLLLNPKLDNISGMLGQTGVTSLWGEAGTAKQIWNQISSQLQLQGATLAKGQGAVSDYERSIFKGAAVNASRGQSDAEFRKSLVNMRGALSLASGLKVPMKVTDPTTGEVREYTLDRDGVITAEKNGLMIEAVDNIVAN